MTNVDAPILMHLNLHEQINLCFKAHNEGQAPVDFIPSDVSS